MSRGRVCARAIIRSNLTYPRDDSMGTSGRLKERNYVFALCVSLRYRLSMCGINDDSRGAGNDLNGGDVK